MLESASGSLTSYPGHPPAANEGLMSLVPDFILGPRKALDFGELQQPGRRGTTRFFGTGSRVPMDWAASAIKFGHQVLKSTSGGRANMTRVAKGQSAPRRGGVVHYGC
jgi:hypothetical protein